MDINFLPAYGFYTQTLIKEKIKTFKSIETSLRGKITSLNNQLKSNQDGKEEIRLLKLKMRETIENSRRKSAKEAVRKNSISRELDQLRSSNVLKFDMNIKCTNLMKLNRELIAENSRLISELSTTRTVLKDAENSSNEIFELESTHKNTVLDLKTKLKYLASKNSELMDKLNAQRVVVEIENVLKNQSFKEPTRTKRKNKGMYKQEFRQMDSQIKQLEAHILKLEKTADEHVREKTEDKKKQSEYEEQIKQLEAHVLKLEKTTVDLVQEKTEDKQKQYEYEKQIKILETYIQAFKTTIAENERKNMENQMLIMEKYKRILDLEALVLLLKQRSEYDHQTNNMDKRELITRLRQATRIPDDVTGNRRKPHSHENPKFKQTTTKVTSISRKSQSIGLLPLPTAVLAPVHTVPNRLNVMVASFQPKKPQPYHQPAEFLPDSSNESGWIVLDPNL